MVYLQRGEERRFFNNSDLVKKHLCAVGRGWPQLKSTSNFDRTNGLFMCFGWGTFWAHLISSTLSPGENAISFSLSVATTYCKVSFESETVEPANHGWTDSGSLSLKEREFEAGVGHHQGKLQRRGKS